MMMKSIKLMYVMAGFIAISILFLYPSVKFFKDGRHYNQDSEKRFSCSLVTALIQAYDAEKLKTSIDKTVEAISVIEKELKDFKNKTVVSGYSAKVENRPTTSKKYDEVAKKSAELRKRKVLILLTQMRSGSSVIGELFNQKHGVPYFYEPVYPFGETPCKSQWQNRTQVVESIAHCRLENLKSLYAEGFNRSQRPDHFSR